MALEKIRGSYALVVLDSQDPDRIVAVRKECPLIVGIGEGEFFIASDVLAFLHHTNRVIYLEDGEMAVIETPFPQVLSSKKAKIKKEIQKITWSPVMAEKAGYKHFMQKEIFEQPQAVRRYLSRPGFCRKKGRSYLPEIGLTDREIERHRPDRIIIACGTSWHAALVGKFLLEEYCRIPTEVDYASEYPLPQSGCQCQDLADSDFPIRRDGRYPGRLAGRQKEKAPGLGHLQCGGQQHCPGSRRRDLYPCRPGNRGGLDQGLYHPTSGPLSDDPLHRTNAKKNYPEKTGWP